MKLEKQIEFTGKYIILCMPILKSRLKVKIYFLKRSQSKDFSVVSLLHGQTQEFHLSQYVHVIVRTSIK